MSARTYQPYLHDLMTLVSAPVVALSAGSGQISGGADGVYLGDRRLLSALEVTFSGDEAAPVDAVPASAAECEFLGVLRGQGDTGPDPTVFLTRRRTLSGTGLTETLQVHSAARESLAGTLRVRAGCDLADMSTVKSGGTGSPVPVTVDEHGWRWSASHGTTVTLSASSPTTAGVAGDGAEADALEWGVHLAPGETFTLRLTLGVEQATPPLGIPAPSGLPLVRVHGHREMDAFVARSIDDLDALVMADPQHQADRYVAAGAPWYLTLFGRDSLWTARMLLGAGTELAGETLRVLARRQGTREDPESAEAPGKIMHEIRSAPTEHGGRGPETMSLPPLYYGTIDATPLWVLLLHDAWRWGLPEPEVSALMPNAERAMSWVRRAAESHNGFLSYRDESGHGLSNQGWKDSGDAIQFRDGRLAEAPIALCEVQAYAHQAALAYAALLDRFGGEGAAEWRDWAGDLAERFRAAYWLEDETGRYPATALDAGGQPVDTVTSNIGHLLGTGLLGAEEERLVVHRLASPLMDSGFGLRTLAGDSDGFNPLSYHAGSVWTHDTAIAVMGLAAAGDCDADRLAASLVDGLLRAARVFDYRMPELYGGQSAADRQAPAPYPAACRPQAWSAASAIAVLTAALGLRPDVPAGVVRCRPLRPWTFGPVRVEGLRIAGRRIDVEVDERGELTVQGELGDLQVAVE